MISRTLFLRLLAITLVAGSPESQREAVEAPSPVVVRVQEFGAVGDGTALDTAAIQKAIDACTAAGGGTVYFSPGVYLSGSVFLKDNVRLLLEANAVLRGSARPEDYPPAVRQDPDAPSFGIPEVVGGGFLIYGEGVQNVSIEGRGTIDGQGSKFWFEEMLSAMVRKPMPNRPRALIAIVKGDSLRVRDVTLANSSCYTLWTIGCNNVTIDGITIRNPHDGPNTDGIDIDCCSDVRIANCSIDGGDDAIAIKSDAGLLGEDKPCENITVTNCVLCSVPACGVRIGYEGDSIIRNCSFSNLTIFDTDIGLDIVSILPGRPNIVRGTRCENITFNNVVMRNVNQALYFWMGNETGEQSQVHLKNILVSNVIAQSRYGSYVGGFDKKHCENVTLSNIQFLLTGDMPEGAAPAASGVWGAPANPYALYCARVDGLRIQDVDIDLRAARGAWRYGLFCDEVYGAALSNIRTRGLVSLPAQAAIGLKGTSASVRDCDAEPGIPAFLHAVQSSRMFVSGCDLSQAQKTVIRDEDSTLVASDAETAATP
ncbi:MAG TPA: glycoside hydrolase family 28 protein [Candidatus Hydrogenedentes bacterium]|nr:glycoside hydrolase family 28 protein [Candidatus Hydrogenedentota bacterium]HQH51123.1 glycoside hydrolase family 28 protein [Candidatus Hydrogenedentota bacterium]